jgi:hypothetical protein
MTGTVGWLAGVLFSGFLVLTPKTSVLPGDLRDLVLTGDNRHD